MDYIVTRPHTRKHQVGDIITLTERHAAALVNKVEPKLERGLSTDAQATQDKIDELELTVSDLREQLIEAKKPKRRGRKPKPEADPEALLDGI